MFKINKNGTRTTPGVFIVNFEHICCKILQVCLII